MSTETDLVDLERTGWDALSRRAAPPRSSARCWPGGAGAASRGMVISNRVVVASMGDTPWSSYELGDVRVVPLGEDAAVVAYRATSHSVRAPPTRR